jgi:hypothetical protein
MDQALDGHLRDFSNGGTVQMGTYVATKENCPRGGCTYGGVTNGMDITFSTLGGTAAIRQMNIYHEFGHLLDNSPGNVDVFSKAVGALTNPSFIKNGYIDSKALISGRVYDPSYGSAEALQHPSTDPIEQWGDIFANYVAGNINLDTTQGIDMNTFITGELP